MLFILTDGASNDKSKTAAAAKTLHKRGINVFSVGVSGAQPDELEDMASDPKYVYTYNDFSKLSELQNSFLTQTCEGTSQSFLPLHSAVSNSNIYISIFMSFMCKAL